MSRPLEFYEEATRLERLNAYSACAEILLLGEDNPVNTRPEFALWNEPANCAGERLCNWILKMRGRDYLATWRTNLCMSGRWSQAEAGARATVLLRAEAPWRTIIMLGRKVAKTLEPITGFMPPFTSGRVQYNDVAFGVASIPHPSGRSREWNDPSSYDRARAAILAIEPRMPLNIPVEDL